MVGAFIIVRAILMIDADKSINKVTFPSPYGLAKLEI